MQNRYAGDIGDFGKLSLLRALLNSSTHKLGVVWYLYPDENHNEDGKHTKYLYQDNYSNVDPALLSKLKNVVENNRCVRELEKSNVLPNTTIYFSDVLDFHITNSSQTNADKEARLRKRTAWLEKAVAATSNCSAVFLDPDNGLEVPSCSKINQIKSGKYLYYSELQQLSNGKNVCIIYHHLNRHSNHGSHSEQIYKRTVELRERINPGGRIFAIRFRPYSPRAFFILTSSSASDEIHKALNLFLEKQNDGSWDYFTQG